MTWILLIAMIGNRPWNYITYPTAIAVHSQAFNSSESCNLAGNSFAEINVNDRSTLTVKWLCVEK